MSPILAFHATNEVRHSRKNASGLLTSMQLAYVLGWQGDNTTAALNAGYSNPKQAAAKLMKVPAVHEAIQAKQLEVVRTSGRLLSKKLTRTDLIDAILRTAEQLKSASEIVAARSRVRNEDLRTLARTCDSLVKCYMSLAELEGYVIGRRPK